MHTLEDMVKVVDRVQKSFGAVLSTLANFNMMDKVTLANLGDLIQPFQNSRYFSSAYKVLVFIVHQNLANQLNIIHTKIALQANLKDAYISPLVQVH